MPIQHSIWIVGEKPISLAAVRLAETVIPAKDFMVPTPDGDRPGLDVLQHGAWYRKNIDDPDKSEYFVRVTWLDTVPLDKAVNEVGLFGNQNSVCQPLTPKWRHTVERLKTHFPKWNAQA